MVSLADLPRAEPHMVVARDSWQALGGTSAGKALHLADRGIAVRLITALADDDAGSRVRESLAGLDVRVLPTAATERHLNLMSQAGERVSIFLEPPADATPPPVSEVLGAAAVVLDLSPWTRRLAEGIARSSLTVWTDLHDVHPDDDWYAPFIQAASYVQCSGDRLTDRAAYLRRLVDDGARMAVCTLGADGAIGVDASGECRVGSLPVPVLDTNGAGDAFFAGLLAATLGGADLQEAMNVGVTQTVRALTTRELGPLLGVDGRAGETS